MFIRTQNTPNPATLKFIPDDRVVVENGSYEFKNQKQASSISPLAMQLFEVKGVQAVFLGHDFITITKDDKVDWQEIKTEIQSMIMDFFVSNKPVLFAKQDPKSLQENSSVKNNQEGDSAIVLQIKELIEIKVRPAVAMDGGDIIFHSFENGIVYLVLKGSCSGCPSSTVTLKNGIENMLKHYIPEVEAVEQVDDE